MGGGENNNKYLNIMKEFIPLPQQKTEGIKPTKVKELLAKPEIITNSKTEAEDHYHCGFYNLAKINFNWKIGAYLPFEVIAPKEALEIENNIKSWTRGTNYMFLTSDGWNGSYHEAYYYPFTLILSKRKNRIRQLKNLAQKLTREANDLTIKKFKAREQVRSGD